MNEFSLQFAAIDAMQDRVGIFIWSTESEDETGGPAGPVTEIDLGDTETSDETLIMLRGYTHLEWLCLEDTCVTDAGLRNLAALKNLKKLELHGTQVTEAGASLLRKMLPNCEIEL